MRTLINLFCVLALLIAPAALRADNDPLQAERGWSVTGKVSAINDRGRLIEIYDRSDRHYTVTTEDARVYDGYKEKRVRDIHEGDTIRVFADDRNDRVIKARSIYKLSREDGLYGDRPTSVRTTGIIRKLDRGARKIELAVDDSTEKVFFTRETSIMANSKRVDVEYLRTGDYIRVEGNRTRNGDIIATAIYLQDSRQGSDHRGRSITARVIDDAGMFSRSLKVAPTTYGEQQNTYEVQVPKDAAITRNGRGVSVHEIRTGDIITAEGRWDDGKFVASRIEANEYGSRRNDDSARRLQSITGRIRRINSGQRQITVITDAGDVTIYADRARVSGDRDVRRFEDLRRGDTVQVQGRASGRYIDAERIEVVNGDRGRGQDESDRYRSRDDSGPM